MFSALSAGIAVGVVVALGLATVVALSRANRGQMRQAVRIVSIGLLTMAGLATLISPDIVAVLIFVPVLVAVLALPYIDGRELRVLMIAGLAELVVMLAGARFVRLFEPLPSWTTDLVVILFVPVIVGLILLLLWQFRHRLVIMLDQTRAANEELQLAQAGLEAQVAERTAALQVALDEVQARADEQARLLAENEQQRLTIREISVPVLPVSAETLVMPLVGALDTERLRLLQEQALHALERSTARHLLLDITGVPVVDSQVAQGLIAVVQAGRLLGAEVTLVGIRPEVAQAIVGLGLNLQEVRTYSDLRTALG
jgi:rsbT co-antagonist protein RsbR